MFKVVLKRGNLEKAMLRHNLNSSDMAKILGLSRSHFSRVVHGQYEPSPAIRQQLLDYFKGFKFDDLFTIEETSDDERTRV
jgi:transcriptional regulator with XRE-family HTH domain